MIACNILKKIIKYDKTQIVKILEKINSIDLGKLHRYHIEILKTMIDEGYAETILDKLIVSSPEQMDEIEIDLLTTLANEGHVDKVSELVGEIKNAIINDQIIKLVIALMASE